MRIFGRRLCALITLLPFAITASADFKIYEAALDESSWQFQGNPLSCRLSHAVPHYGIASFSKSGGRRSRLGFTLSYNRQPVTAQPVAWVRSITPSWYPLRQGRELGQVKLNSQSPIIQADTETSWRLLSELEVGRFPSFQYQEFRDPSDQVRVSLSAVGFRDEYDKFLACMQDLVRYDLKELTRMTLFFDFDKASVRSGYRDKLNDLAKYIKYDPSIEVVLVAGYTDAKGPRSYNDKLAKKRAQRVKSLLQLEGVSDDRFKVLAYGESNPIATNRTERGRAKNRRVVIRVAQN